MQKLYTNTVYGWNVTSSSLLVWARHKAHSYVLSTKNVDGLHDFSLALHGKRVYDRLPDVM